MTLDVAKLPVKNQHSECIPLRHSWGVGRAKSGEKSNRARDKRGQHMMTCVVSCISACIYVHVPLYSNGVAHLLIVLLPIDPNGSHSSVCVCMGQSGWMKTRFARAVNMCTGSILPEIESGGDTARHRHQPILPFYQRLWRGNVARAKVQSCT